MWFKDTYRGTVFLSVRVKDKHAWKLNNYKIPETSLNSLFHKTSILSTNFETYK